MICFQDLQVLNTISPGGGLQTMDFDVGLGGLGITCSPRDPRFACSIPAEVDGFFQNVNILSTSPPGGTLSRGSRVKESHP